MSSPWLQRQDTYQQYSMWMDKLYVEQQRQQSSQQSAGYLDYFCRRGPGFDRGFRPRNSSLSISSNDDDARAVNNRPVFNNKARVPPAVPRREEGFGDVGGRRRMELLQNNGVNSRSGPFPESLVPANRPTGKI
jgi:hypothetical protein